MQSASFLFRNHNFPINIPDVLFNVHAVDIAEINLLLTDGFHELIVSRMTDGIRKEESVIRLVSKKKNWNAMFFGNNTSLPRFNSS